MHINYIDFNLQYFIKQFANNNYIYIKGFCTGNSNFMTTEKYKEQSMTWR